jgi:hypothetical protein
MSTEEVFVQQFAKLFVHYREALTLNQDSRTGAGAAAWNEVPEVERDRMVAAARLALMEIEDTTAGEADHSRYFAKPGEAEWGC